MTSRREITMLMVGAVKCQSMPSWEATAEAVAVAYPGSHPQGSALGWSWVDDDGMVVASACPVLRYPYYKWWLALRPK